MPNYYLEHHNGVFDLLEERKRPPIKTFATQKAGIDYAKTHFPPPRHGLHVERVEYLQTGEPPQWRKVH